MREQNKVEYGNEDFLKIQSDLKLDIKNSDWKGSET